MNTSKRTWNELSSEEKKKVEAHYKACIADESMGCQLHNDVEEFWEAHKEMDYPECPECKSLDVTRLEIGGQDHAECNKCHFIFALE